MELCLFDFSTDARIFGGFGGIGHGGEMAVAVDLLIQLTKDVGVARRRGDRGGRAEWDTSTITSCVTMTVTGGAGGLGELCAVAGAEL